MAPQPEYGRTTLAPVNVLPEMPLDLSEVQPLPADLGKTDTPVHVLPELALDFRPTVPALRLQLTLRAGAAPGQVSLDLFRLYAAVNQLDLSLHGAGLLPGEAAYDEQPPNGTLSVTFKPAEPHGAAERLAHVVSAINAAQAYPSLLRCEAKVVSIAA
jgi:hypothetical protein